ncbi:putative phosphatidylinositol 3,4,5-trisphosphate 3-phosphatase [Monocercomonoides exilis]|uniref:putative phosphatidylinositol 3,4,5-trisphosphate 3-phosphatase n=1 Tax=Monocercomonoides exilis TaxID=2049356 RepID=UPI00355A8A13|nr:putative phosphatidylinositol 3,4,5-trisphosphate 3-phosphatase [Monocercomonoides exilis]|eukprot:MONOS_1380.1-p1 / transcript=MONOS_1380.1 / gene=MONOS_1380 / organism=Monocercomonoides_exilis_PA203 / gene_product=pten protein / transcript_product=pten protein / location=Mono_scaffold00024:29316-32158(-) / protein_length=744 / sequence_SO=supercontig / SO=protein_coding / is_pseudo=false
MGYPSESFESLYRNSMADVKKFLNHHHKDHYRVYNLCCEPDRQYDHANFDGRVGCYQFPDHNAPPFEIIDEFCKDCKEWMDSHPDNVCVVHCKAGKGRTGLMICCLLLYLHTCPSAEESMMFYGLNRTHNHKGVTIPCQRRYISYYDRWLSRPLTVKLNQTLHLSKIVVSDVPDWNGKGMQANIIVRNHTKVLYDLESNVKELPRYPMGMAHCEYLLPSVLIDGDVCVRFMEKKKQLFQVWFNTHFVTSNPLVFGVEDTDKAISDKKHKHFSDTFSFSLYFTEKVEDTEDVEEWEKQKKSEAMSKVQEAIQTMKAEKIQLQEEDDDDDEDEDEDTAKEGEERKGEAELAGGMQCSSTPSSGCASFSRSSSDNEGKTERRCSAFDEPVFVGLPVPPPPLFPDAAANDIQFASSSCCPSSFSSSPSSSSSSSSSASSASSPSSSSSSSSPQPHSLPCNTSSETAPIEVAAQSTPSSSPSLSPSTSSASSPSQPQDSSTSQESSSTSSLTDTNQSLSVTQETQTTVESSATSSTDSSSTATDSSSTISSSSSSSQVNVITPSDSSSSTTISATPVSSPLLSASSLSATPVGSTTPPNNSFVCAKPKSTLRNVVFHNRSSTATSATLSSASSNHTTPVNSPSRSSRPSHSPSLSSPPPFPSGALSSYDSSSSSSSSSSSPSPSSSSSSSSPSSSSSAFSSPSSAATTFSSNNFSSLLLPIPPASTPSVPTKTSPPPPPPPVFSSSVKL